MAGIQNLQALVFIKLRKEGPLILHSGLLHFMHGNLPYSEWKNVV